MSLHDRIAKALGWRVSDVQSLSMQSLRDLVRPADPDLARELDHVIQSGAYVRGERGIRAARRGHASVRATAATRDVPASAAKAARAHYVRMIA